MLRACAVLPVDLRTDWRGALLASGHDLGQPTAWLVEGLLIYLTATEAGRLLADITATSAPGSRLAFEHGAAASRLLAGRADELPTLGRVPSSGV